MTLNQLVYFQTVARYQHFHRAAEELNISQPSLSRSVATLEEELRIVLFERQGRNVRLTKYGRVFLEHTEKILKDVAVARTQMQQLSGNEGHVDIAYVFPLAAHYIPHMVRRFLKKEKNKNVTFSFHQLHTAPLIEGLKSEKYDIIFGSYVENEPLVQFIPIIHQDMVIITPWDHPLARRGRQRFRIWRNIRSLATTGPPASGNTPDASMPYTVWHLTLSANPRTKTPSPHWWKKPLVLHWWQT